MGAGRPGNSQRAGNSPSFDHQIETAEITTVAFVLPGCLDAVLSRILPGLRIAPGLPAGRARITRMHPDALLESAPVLQCRSHRDTGGRKTLAKTAKLNGMVHSTLPESKMRISPERNHSLKSPG